MRRAGGSGLGLALLLLGAGAVPHAARAQPGFYATPSFSVTEVYDDNVFLTADQRRADFISRFTPGIQAGYQSAPLTLLGSYTFDAEVFAANPELTTPLARQHATIDARYLPSPPLTLSLGAAYLTTETPGEFNTETGLDVGRVPARRLSVTQAVAYRVDRRTAATGDYTFAADEAGGIESDLHGVNLGLERLVTPRDTGSLTYAWRYFVFPEESSTSHAVLLGWTREITPLTTASVRAGPRLTDDSLDPEIAVSIRRRFKSGELSLSYARTQATIIGQRGVVESDSVGVTLVYRPLPSLEVRIAPAFLASTRGDLDATVYRVAVEAVYRISRWLSLTGTYQFSLQQGNLVPGPRADEDIQRNVVTLGLAFTRPYRVR